jgi:sulfopyruvate decarboxylase subunit beta
MNLGSLATIANHNPKNLIIIVLDNGTYGTTGNQASYTSGVTNLEKVARACGFEYCYTAEDEDGLAEIIQKGLMDKVLSFIHVIIKPDNLKMSPIPMGPITVKERFMAAI